MPKEGLELLLQAWRGENINWRQLEEKHMPKLVEGNEAAGTLKKELKNKFQFEKDVVVVGGAGDNAAAAGWSAGISR